jgi:PAP2 superfamily
MRSKLRLSALSACLTIGFGLASAGPFGTVQAAPDNMVIDWNHTMLATFAAAGVPPPPANRLGGIVQAAVFDAVNGIERRYQPIHVQAAAPDDASPKAAAASAAHTALVDLFLAQQSALDAAFTASLAPLTDDEDAQSVADGVAWGAAVADEIVTWRMSDGFNVKPPTYVSSSTPGQWQPTPPGIGEPKFRSLATTTPFALASPSQFRPAGPPALTSALYTQDFNEVKAIGGAISSVRTSYQTQTAMFWQNDTPTAMWDRVADSLALEHHLNLLQTARLLALTNISIADATIAIWDAKNAFNSWRPVTAIVNAGSDGNPDTLPDSGWLPLMTTPYFQEYPSAHSGVSSAAATVLASRFGDDTSFTVTSAGSPGVTRTFTSFSQAVAQVADARVWAGFHFRFSCDDGITLGSQTAKYVEGKLMLPARD